VELDRHFIERNDFGVARRGYDPDEVDRHLRELADAVAELKRNQRKSSTTSSLASAAADQVRGIVEAAERSANDIQQQAEGEARRIVDEANARSRETRERADADAMQRVQSAEQATERMLERSGGVETEIDRLLGELRSAAGSLVENLRTSSTGLNDELTQIRTEFAGVREARLEDGTGTPSSVSSAPPPPVVDEPEPISAVDGDAGPVDAEPEVVEEVEETVVEAEDEAPAEEVEEAATDEDAYEEEPVAEAEPEETVEEEAPAVPEEAPAESSARGGRSIRGAEGARLIALNMALNGTPRDETARYLSQNFDLDDQDSLLDEVYARVGG
jgi:DivIVA domain-containing protein